MSEWKKVRLGDIISIKSGLSYKSEFIGKGDNLLLGMGCVSYKEQFLDSGVRPYSQDCDTKYLAAPGDLVLATRQQSDYLPILAMPAIIPEKYRGKKIIIGTNLYRVENHSDIDNRFLFFVLKGLDYVNYIRGVKTGTTVQMVSKRNVEEYRFLCPPKEAREYIVYDSLIENYQKQIKLLEEAAQRLYKEWFVDLHFPGHENTKIVNGVPEGWEKKKIAEVCDTIGGGTPSTKIASYYEGGTISWVTPTDITKNNSLCLLSTEKKITKEGLSHSSAKMLPKEAILMTSRASVGYFGICDFEVCTNQGFISCVPFDKDFQMYLLYNLMNRVEEIRIKAGGSTYLEINKSVFRNFDIICPVQSVTVVFQRKAHRFLERTRIVAKQIHLLTEARDRLLPKLMSGDIAV